MKRRFNTRLPVLIASAVAAGIFAGYIAVFYAFNILWFIAVAPQTAIIFIILRFVFKARRAAAYTVVFGCVFLIGAAVSFYALIEFSQSAIVSGYYYPVTGTVVERGQTDYGNFLILKNVTVDGRHIFGRIYCTVYGETDCEAGYKVSFIGSVIKYDLFPYGKLHYNAADNIKYGCTVYSDFKSEYGFSLFGTIRTAIRNLLYGNLDNDTASIVYAMLTGNTQGMDSGALTAFRQGGIAHIFAVSGLHIGIVYGAVYALLKACRVNRKIAAPITVAVVFLYSGICGFTLSSVRAAIMCAVNAAAMLSRRKYDGLNSLAVAVILILIIKPLSLFTVGFQLSVCAVAGIFLFSKPLERLLKKLPRRLRSAISLSLSATAGTAPVMLANFGYLSAAGLLLNIVVVPVISVIFTLLFACTVIGLIIPPAGILLTFAALPLQAIVSFLVAGGFENALISGFGAGAFTAIYFIGLLALTDKIKLKLLTRIIAVGLAAVIAVTYVFFRINAGWNGYSIIVAGRGDGGCMIIKSARGSIVIVTENSDPDSVRSAAFNAYCSSPDAIIVIGGENAVAIVSQLGLNCKTVYIFEQNIPIQPFGGIEIRYEAQFTAGGVEFRFADSYSLFAQAGGAEIAYCAGDFIPFGSCDLLVSATEDLYCVAKYTVSTSRASADYRLTDHGSLTFHTVGDDLRLISLPRPTKRE